MAQKRKAREAKETQGSLSAFAAAAHAKKQRHGDQAQRHAVALTPQFEVEQESQFDAPSQTVTERDLASKPYIEIESTNIIPSDTNLTSADYSRISNGDEIEVVLRTDESLTVVGEYDVQVCDGIISIYGAVLRSGGRKYRVCAPTHHGVPAIIGRRDESRIVLSSVPSGIGSLSLLSPLFRNLWTIRDDHSQSFSMVPPGIQGTLLRTLMPLLIDNNHKRVLAKLNARLQTDRRAPYIMAVGAKSAGKSTFNRLLCNMIISRPGNERCIYLDLDPGQPEFGPPGTISLVDVRVPLLGPAFSHPARRTSSQLRLIRSHALASTSFNNDPEHYMACIADLIRHAPQDVPMVINSCGWTSGLGAIALLDIVKLLRDVEIIALNPVERSLVDAFRSHNCEIHILERFPISPAMRTPAEQRAMHTMAYFHHKRLITNDEAQWSAKPLTATRSWTVSYAEQKSGLSAIVSYGQQPHPAFISEILVGAIVAIVSTNTEFKHAASIERTVGEKLPYVTANEDGYVQALDPRHCECHGLGLVRGINTDDQTLDLFTPLSDSTIAALNDLQVVLVRGNFDPPDWALLEDIHAADGTTDLEYTQRPWVSHREAMVGVESAVWRLRHPPTR